MWTVSPGFKGLVLKVKYKLQKHVHKLDFNSFNVQNEFNPISSHGRSSLSFDICVFVCSHCYIDKLNYTGKRGESCIKSKFKTGINHKPVRLLIKIRSDLLLCVNKLSLLLMNTFGRVRFSEGLVGGFTECFPSRAVWKPKALNVSQLGSNLHVAFDQAPASFGFGSYFLFFKLRQDGPFRRQRCKPVSSVGVRGERERERQRESVFTPTCPGHPGFSSH